MNRNHSKIRPGTPARIALAFLVIIGSACCGWSAAHSAEIIPFVGFTRPTTSDNDQTQVSGGLALRGNLISPFLQDEIGVSYRSESRFNDQLRVRMWPITASLWLSPVPSLYAGAGVGLYNISLDYNQNTLGTVFQDETRQDFGVHVGGGVRVPLAPAASIDLGARYVMLRDQQDRLVPDHFNPDFWTANLGLALRF